ncbi:MAG: ribosomal RNA small subunit methyltransferase I [Tepidiforma sp.]|nr:MAG: ribosomal RNA small subunit methyltransferase I [Tepidiforma sp.]
MTTWHPGLYVTATPLGNLGDLSPRAAEALREAILIAAEDTRVTGRLARLAGSTARLVSLTEYNVEQRTAEVLAAAREGVAVLASDAGTPGVSDPGARLVAAAHAEHVRVVPIPGPSALAAAVSVAGFDSEIVVFAGFLPRKAGERRSRLVAITGPDRMAVCFEGRGRVGALLGDVAEVLGDPEVVVCRELTKRHEEVVRARASNLIERFAGGRGEFTVVIGPTASRPAEESRAAAMLAAFKRAGARRSAAAAEVAKLTGAERAALYALWERLPGPDER